MTFAECIPLLLNLKKLKRVNQHENMYIELDPDDDMSLTSFKFTKSGRLMDYKIYKLTADDLTATDWEVINNEHPQRNM